MVWMVNGLGRPKLSKEDKLSDLPEDIEDLTAKAGDHKTAMFNKAIPFLAHIQSLELVCSESAIMGDFQKWYDTLHAWFNKLTGKLLKEKRDADIRLVDDLFDKIGPLVGHPYLSDGDKRRLLNMIQRELELLTEEFGYQMPEIGGEDDEPLKFT